MAPENLPDDLFGRENCVCAAPVQPNGRAAFALRADGFELWAHHFIFCRVRKAPRLTLTDAPRKCLSVEIPPQSCGEVCQVCTQFAGRRRFNDTPDAELGCVVLDVLAIYVLQREA